MTLKTTFSLQGRCGKALLNSSRLIAWLAVNPSTIHPKLIPIPLGINNQKRTKSGDVISDPMKLALKSM